MRRLNEIRDRMYAPSLAYDMSFDNGKEAEKIFHEHAAGDIHFLLQEVERLEEENKTLRKYLHEDNNKV